VAVEIKIEGLEELSGTIGAMIGLIDHYKRVDIGQELSDWQVNDMHRHKPFTMRARAKGSATTKVRPHSLFEMKRSTRAHRQLMRRLRARRKKGGGIVFIPMLVEHRHWSTRDILRREMIDSLADRMHRLKEQKLGWDIAKQRVKDALAAASEYLGAASEL